MRALTHREIRLLSLLAQGRTYKQIIAQLRWSPANVHTTCHDIRKKTGIEQTRDAEECKRYLSTLDPKRVAVAMAQTQGFPQSGPTLTFCQLDVFRLIAAGRSWAQIAQALGINAQSAQNLASRACKRVGIIHAGWNRKKYIREWVESNAPLSDPMDDPMF